MVYGTKGGTQCHAQLEGEGTGEDGGQEDGVPADEGPIHDKSPRLDSKQAIGVMQGQGDVLVDNVGDLEMRQVSLVTLVRRGSETPMKEGEADEHTAIVREK
jgi:hypothetical protein